MTISILTFIVLALCTYRITRFLIVDGLIDGTREKLHVFLANRKGLVAHKALELASCTWCAGFYVAIGVVSVFFRLWPWELGVDRWILVGANAAASGLLHAFEPTED